MKYYRGLKAMEAPVDVITEAKDFSKYKFLIAPSYQLIDKDLIARFQKFADEWRHVNFTCRSGQKDRRGHLWETLWAEPIYDLAGAAIPKYDVLPEGRNGNVSFDGHEYLRMGLPGAIFWSREPEPKCWRLTPINFIKAAPQRPVTNWVREKWCMSVWIRSTGSSKRICFGKCTRRGAQGRLICL